MDKNRVVQFRNKIFQSRSSKLKMFGLMVFLIVSNILSGFPQKAFADAAGYALEFDGVDDYVALGDTGDLMQSPDWPSEKTISLWLKPTGLTPPLTFPTLGELILGVDQPRLFGITRADFQGDDQLFIWNSDLNGVDYIGIPITLGVWIQITMVHSGGILSAYKNGELVGTIPSGPTIVPGGTVDGNLYLGGSGRSNPSLYFQGQIDEVRFWGNALDQTMVRDWLYSELTTSHSNWSNLAAYYTVFDGSGTLLADDYDGSNPGLLQGGMSDESWVPSEALLPPGGSTDTPIPPTDTPFPTNTQIPPTATPFPADTPILPTNTPIPTDTPSPTMPPLSNAIIIDHRSVALFDQIPAQYLEIARNTPMLFSDRSVGHNINNYLNCLASGSEWYDAPAYCRRDYYDTSNSFWRWKTFSRTDYQNNQVPERILFDPDPLIYDRSNWVFEYRMGDWHTLTEDFVSGLVPLHANSKDVLSYQFSYLNIDFDLTITAAPNPQGSSRNPMSYGGYFASFPEVNGRYDISDIQALEAQYPNKTFMFWTTSLSRSLGSSVAEDFNNQMRLYAIENNKILFDVADIELHDDNGNPCFDNRDAVEYCNSNGCENYPDDGQNTLAICQDYTTEVDGGHLGSVSGGGIRIAKAFWVLMAMQAGWTP